jgi:tetratricopeptide (TPR) repeat protein
VSRSQTTLFLSSTSFDLTPFREAAIHVCTRLGLGVVAMEKFGPDPHQAAALCREKVRDADLFLGLYAHRYGQQFDEFGGKSITELEYEWAIEAKKPVLLFAIDDELPWPPKYIEEGEQAARLKQLKSHLRARHVLAKLTTPAQLLEDLFVHLPRIRDQDRAPTRDRSPIPPAPEPYVAHQYSLLQTRQVIGRAQELARLDEWAGKAKKDSARILCIVSIGGNGKSAVTWKWFHERAPWATPDLAGRMWWSFYETDAGFDRFVAAALAYASGRPLASVEGMTAIDRENELLAELDRRPFLLCLDGLERILIAYASAEFAHLAEQDLDDKTANQVIGARGLPAGATGSFVGQRRLRRTIDARAGNLLRKLAQVQQSRLLITTRLYPSELQTATGHELPGSAAWFLRGLENTDALRLWRAMGVSGDDEQLTALFATFENYPLLIRALAGEVSRFRAAPGDFDAWKRANPRFDPYALPLVQVKTHVLEQALHGLRQSDRELLHTVAAFRSPTDYQTLAALFIEREGWSSPQLDAALTELEDRGLLGWDRSANRYDLHPIVRGVVWSGIDEERRREVYRSMEAHFEAKPPPADGFKTAADAQPTVELFNALVGLGRHAEAGDLYFEHLQAFTANRSVIERVALLESLFPKGTEKSPQAADNDALVLAHLGHCCFHAGELDRAHDLYSRSLNVRGTRPIDPSEMRLIFYYLSRVDLMRGHLYAAAEVEGYAIDSEFVAKPERAHFALLRALVGNVGSAVSELEWLDRDQFFHPAPYLAQIHLWKGNHLTCLREIRKVEDAVRKPSTVALTLALIKSEALIELCRIPEAVANLNGVLRDARTLSWMHHELRALCLLAEANRRLGELERARMLLDDLWDPASRGPHRLVMADAFNVVSALEDDGGRRDVAVAAAERAYLQAWCDGPPFTYHWGLEKAKRLLDHLEAPRPSVAAAGKREPDAA